MTITGAAEREKPGPPTSRSPATSSCSPSPIRPWPTSPLSALTKAQYGLTATAYRARFATGAIHLMPFAEGWTTRAAAAVMAD
jgi:hypothetical protein